VIGGHLHRKLIRIWEEEELKELEERESTAAGELDGKSDQGMKKQILLSWSEG